jgi:uncharacterized delta-60 repeat protein
MQFNKIWFITLVFSLCSIVMAQSGSLDTSFGSGSGKLVLSVPTTGAVPRDMVAQSDGKIVSLLGNRSNNSTYYLLRINANGAVDSSFGNNGLVTLSWGLINKAFTYYADANAVAVQNINGTERILMAGSAPMVSGKSVQTLYRIDRFLPNGSPDPSFGTNGTVFLQLGQPKHMVVQPDQKIITVSSDTNELVRLNPNGTLDPTFGSVGKVASPDAYRVALDPNGTIVVAGFLSSRQGNTTSNNASLRRYFPNGVLDASFGTNGVALANFGFQYFNLKSLYLDNGRNIVLGGRIQNSDLSTRDFRVARFTPAGFPDASFSGDGMASAGFTLSDVQESNALVQSSGKIVLVGSVWVSSSAPPDAAAVRFNFDGSLDSSFGSGGRTIFDIAGSDYVTGGKGGIIQFDPGCTCEKIVVAGGNDFVTTFARLTAY